MAVNGWDYSMTQAAFGGYGGWNPPDVQADTKCTHVEISCDDFVSLCVPRFGGSFQDLYEYLKRKGYVIMKKEQP